MSDTSLSKVLFSLSMLTVLIITVQAQVRPLPPIAPKPSPVLVPTSAHALKADREALTIMPLTKRPDLVAPPPVAKPHVGALPPAEFDKPFLGKLRLIRGDKFLMDRLCPKSAFKITLGCAYASADRDQCIIILATDQIIHAAGWTVEIVFRHEQGHCWGFSSDHRGARPATPENLANYPPADVNAEERKDELEPRSIDQWRQDYQRHLQRIHDDMGRKTPNAPIASKH